MSVVFKNWYRTGAAASIRTPQAAAPQNIRGLIHSWIKIATDKGPLSVDRAHHVAGPADENVTRIEHAVLGIAPRPGDPEASHERLPHIEFDRADLPWVYTPFGPDPDTGTLAPWLVLVVVEDRDGVSIGRVGRSPRDVLTVDDPSRELPNLDQAHAWAHVQMSGPDVTTATRVKDLIATEPFAVRSRLVCPRLLEPKTSYIAALTPSFEVGRLAGLGQDPYNTPNGWAWNHASNEPVLLPVYLHWRFTTARDSGFEALVRRLRSRTPAELPGVGLRPMDVTHPGGGLPNGAAGDTPTVDVGGAFRVPRPAGHPPPRTAAAALREQIGSVVEQVDQLAPPMYGRWHAAQTKLEDPAARHGWVTAINVEPARRVYAGECGARTVQHHQEQFMAAAWDQFGSLVAANALLRQGQVDLHVALRIFARHLTPLDDLSLLQLAGAALSRLRTGDGDQTLRGRIAGSCLPLAALDPAFTRVTRLGGHLAKRLEINADDVEGDLRRTFELFVAGQARLHTDDPDGPEGNWSHRLNGQRDSLIESVRGTRAADAAVFDTIARRATTRAHCRDADTAELARIARAGLDPHLTVPERFNELITLPDDFGWTLDQRLEPIMAAPEIPIPLYLPLAEHNQDWLLPGLEHVPANSTVGLEADNEFVECVLAGANFEMGRELLWRGFPTDQAGTVLSRFFDIRTQGEPFAKPQIEPIHTWGRSSDLGTHILAGTRVGFVLLVRGDLIRRFPNALISLVKAHWVRDATGDPVYDAAGNPLRKPRVDPVPDDENVAALFGGLLDPDVLFLGFPLTVEQARGHVNPDQDAGWFVRIQERLSEPGFEISDPAEGDEPADVRTWRDLYRALVATNTSGHIDASTPPSVPPVLADQWIARAAVLAGILHARKFRSDVHVDDLVPGSPA